MSLNNEIVSPLSCVSCVPASCVHIWFVSCPHLRWSWVNPCPAVFVSLCVNYPVYLVPVFWVRVGLVNSLLPVFPVCIKDYYLSLRPRVLVPPCCVHRDRRPDLTVSGAPSPRFCFPCLKSVFYLFLCFVSHGQRVRWPRALMPADRGRYSPPAGSLVPGLPLPQASPPARLWLNARWPASDSMPAGSPLTQARRIAANPSPVDRVHMSRQGVPCLSCCAHRNILTYRVLSCPRRLVWGRWLLLLWPRRPF